MRHRHWFLIAAGACLFFAFVFLRLPVLPNFYVNYGETDIRTATALAIAFTLCWLALEILDRILATRPLRCRCGYDLSAAKCPECGQAVGGPKK